jgi:hypothetical protein
VLELLKPLIYACYEMFVYNVLHKCIFGDRILHRIIFARNNVENVKGRDREREEKIGVCGCVCERERLKEKEKD